MELVNCNLVSSIQFGVALGKTKDYLVFANVNEELDKLPEMLLVVECAHPCEKRLYWAEIIVCIQDMHNIKPHCCDLEYLHLFVVG